MGVSGTLSHRGVPCFHWNAYVDSGPIFSCKSVVKTEITYVLNGLAQNNAKGNSILGF
jgi:hypothetical protein